MSAGGGAPLVTDTPLSFWGGVDPASGRVVDRHHPLHGASLAGRLLVMPTSRGSCSGSGVLLELLANGRAPAAVLHSEPEDVVTLGAIVAEELFGLSMPVRRIGRDAFAALLREHDARGGDSRRVAGGPADRDDTSSASTSAPVPASALSSPPASSSAPEMATASTTAAPARGSLTAEPPRFEPSTSPVALSAHDRALLDGVHGEAARVAMRILLRMAAVQGATRLLDVTRVHVDGCLYSGPSSLRFAERLVELGARVRVPTTLNALSVDHRRWRAQGVDPAFGEAAAAVGDAYVAMGAAVSYTCAPYLLDDPPAFGEQIGWAESNAVLFANSVLGARTQKYPDFLDVCIALTGRAPAAGCHLDAARRPTLRVDVEPAARVGADDAFWPLLGYHVGTRAGDRVPIVTGLETSAPSADDLKAFCAAFATTASGALCHVRGVTPEAPVAGGGLDANARSPADVASEPSTPDGRLDADALPLERVSAADLATTRAALNTARGTRVDLVCLGNPHFSVSECAALAALCGGRTRHPDTAVVVTTGRALLERARAAGHVDALERFGVAFVTDTCWCMLGEPIVPPAARTLMTNSAKYAHYAPGLVGREVRFGSLADCVDAACTGHAGTR